VVVRRNCPEMVTSCGGFEFTWRRFGGGEDEMAREKEKGLRWWGDGEHERESANGSSFFNFVMVGKYCSQLFS
jgi:hypothetical protein